MQKESASFQTIFSKWSWKEIRNCPGRFIFADGASKLTADDIAGANLPAYEFETKTIPDKVKIIEFTTGGGLISYIKNGGELLHTLNTEDGFARKLEQLGITLPDDVR